MASLAQNAGPRRKAGRGEGAQRVAWAAVWDQQGRAQRLPQGILWRPRLKGQDVQTLGGEEWVQA